MSYVPNDFTIEKIDKSHLGVIKNFHSYEQDLVDFLIDDAFDNQEKNISTTYLWFLREKKELVGYVTILTDSISLNQQLKREFVMKNIPYKSLPALKIGRLCIDNNFLKKGIGRIMLSFVYSRIILINKTAGCRFITLDAKRNPDNKLDSMHFYKKMGFSVLRERTKGTTSMYKDLNIIIAEQKTKGSG